ncbi:MAG: hypothetical protein FJ086_13485, partial [Deltaproteobacteria bacterium]|nr:hypothetical protein [Deltaproteobacteria bacterium]
VPSSGSCAGYGVFTGLTPGVSYQYEIRAVDQVGLSPAAATTGTVTPASGAALVLSEALYDGPTATESQSEYLEVFNAGDASANVCAYSLAKNGGAATAVCTGTITVPPGGYAVLAGTSFCDAAVSSCATGAWSLPAGTLLARGSNAAPAAGLTNSPAPTLELKSGSTTVSSMGGTGSCPEGESRTRLNLYAPDVPGAFACKPGTPGAATP